MTQELNEQLARLEVQGKFVPCSLDDRCENCACEMRGHFDVNYPGFATRCKCGCPSWSCRHGGGDRVPKHV